MVNGGWSYGYLHIAQSPNIEIVLQNLFNKIKPTRILEIGTLHGGLTMMLSDIIKHTPNPDALIKTYDIHDQEFLKPLVKDRNIEVVTKNLFNDDYTDFKSSRTKKEVKDFISQGSPTVVMCDGGCKKCEVNLIAPLLKPGDIIMAHDYAPNKEFFEEHVKGKIWDWLEIEDKDIQEAIEGSNLKPHLQEAAQKAAWMCKIKN